MTLLIVATNAYTANPEVTGPMKSTAIPAVRINNPAKQIPQRTVPKTTIAHAITISTPPAQGARTKDFNANFTITSNRPGTICWRLDNGAGTCSAPQATRMNVDLQNLTVGNHTLNVVCTDSAANEIQTTRYWTIVY